jgi:hypothetical protein
MANIRRVDVGFQGGQAIALRVTDEEYRKLREALTDDRSGRWHEVKTQDSETTIDLAQVVYVRLETEEHKVGF